MSQKTTAHASTHESCWTWTVGRRFGAGPAMVVGAAASLTGFIRFRTFPYRPWRGACNRSKNGTEMATADESDGAELERIRRVLSWICLSVFTATFAGLLGLSA